LKKLKLSALRIQSSIRKSLIHNCLKAREEVSDFPYLQPP
jgi:hypothetical protein